jgi:hypothetical protein
MSKSGTNKPVHAIAAWLIGAAWLVATLLAPLHDQAAAQVERRELAPIPATPPAPQQSAPAYQGPQLYPQQTPSGPTSLLPPAASGEGPYGQSQQPAYQQPAYQQPAYGAEPGPPSEENNGPVLGAQASYGSGGETPLPPGVWNGVDAASFAKLVAGAPLPSSSPVLENLIARVLAADPPADGAEVALRVDALEKAGRAQEMVTLLRQSAQAGEPGAEARYALALISVGRDEEACGLRLGAVPASAQADNEATRAAFLIPVYCAARAGNMARARDLLGEARQRGLAAPVAEAIIGQLAKSMAERAPIPHPLGVLDYVFLRLGKAAIPADAAKSATPTLLYLLAHDSQAPPELRLEAAERAASLNIIGGTTLRQAYLQAGPQLGKDARSPPALRARLFATFQQAQSAKYRAESIDALLESGKDIGIEVPLAKALAPESAKLAADPQAANFAETGVTVAILAGDTDAAWAWIDRGGAQARSWPLLVAASDPSGPRAAQALQQGAAIAKQAHLSPDLVDRLISVLDALDYNVPLPLWDLSSQQQPIDGYLPETGVLTELKRAADAGQIGRTVMLVAATLGPDGPKGANLLGLGDSVKALRKVGLDAEAKRIGFEALYARWPFHGKV